MAHEPRQGARNPPVTPLVRPFARLAEHAHTRKQFRRLVKDKLFPAWRVHDVAEWYWVKIASETGDPVWPWSAQHRRCYEGAFALLGCMDYKELSQADSSHFIQAFWSAITYPRAQESHLRDQRSRARSFSRLRSATRASLSFSVCTRSLNPRIQGVLLTIFSSLHCFQTSFGRISSTNPGLPLCSNYLHG